MSQRRAMRRSVLGLGALVSLALGLTACVQGPGGPATPTTPAKSGLETLSDAVAKTKGQPYSFTVAYGTLTSGKGWASGDGSATSLNLKVTDAASGLTIDPLEGIVLAQGVYVKANLGVLAAVIPGFDPTKWMHIDPAKAPGAARLGIKPGQDTFGPESFLKGATEATVTSPTEITGKLDISKAAPVGVPADQLAKLSAEARNVAFTTTLDGQGRVTKLVIKMPAVGGYPASDLALTYADWGVAASPAPAIPPAANTVEAPLLIYNFLQ